MKIGLLGYGTVGAGVDEILAGNPDLQVTRIFSRTYKPAMGQRAVFTFDEILKDSAVDTVVELIGGIHPAFEYVMAALKAKKNVVTANKALIAFAYPELIKTAEENQVSLRFSAAAGGGIPWLKNLSEASSVDCITGISGIMNGTSNYILDQMTSVRCSFEEALRSAQEAGYAEADPSSDIDGNDTARKLILSVLIGFSALMKESEIPTFGIRHLTERDLAEAKRLGSAVRLIGFANRMPNRRISAAVLPFFVPLSSPEASVSGCGNLFSYTGTHLGTQSFAGAGAGRYPTATNVIRDLTDLRRHTAYPLPEAPSASAPDNDVVKRFYLRIGETVRVERKPLSAFAEELNTLIRSGENAFGAVLPD